MFVLERFHQLVQIPRVRCRTPSSATSRAISTRLRAWQPTASTSASISSSLSPASPECGISLPSTSTRPTNPGWHPAGRAVPRAAHSQQKAPASGSRLCEDYSRRARFERAPHSVQDSLQHIRIERRRRMASWRQVVVRTDSILSNTIGRGILFERPLDQLQGRRPDSVRLARYNPAQAADQWRKSRSCALSPSSSS